MEGKRKTIGWGRVEDKKDMVVEEDKEEDEREEKEKKLFLSNPVVGKLWCLTLPLILMPFFQGYPLLSYMPVSHLCLTKCTLAMSMKHSNTNAGLAMLVQSCI